MLFDGFGAKMVMLFRTGRFGFSSFLTLKVGWRGSAIGVMDEVSDCMYQREAQI